MFIVCKPTPITAVIITHKTLSRELQRGGREESLCSVECWAKCKSCEDVGKQVDCSELQRGGCRCWWLSLSDSPACSSRILTAARSPSAWPAAWRSRAHFARWFRFRTSPLKCTELVPAGAYAHLLRLQCHFGPSANRTGANSFSPLVRWQHRRFCLCRPLRRRPRTGLRWTSRFPLI